MREWVRENSISTDRERTGGERKRTDCGWGGDPGKLMSSSSVDVVVVVVVNALKGSVEFPDEPAQDGRGLLGVQTPLSHCT